MNRNCWKVLAANARAAKSLSGLRIAPSEPDRLSFSTRSNYVRKVSLHPGLLVALVLWTAAVVTFTWRADVTSRLGRLGGMFLTAISWTLLIVAFRVDAVPRKIAFGLFLLSGPLAAGAIILAVRARSASQSRWIQLVARFAILSSFVELAYYVMSFVSSSPD